jgi:RHS repeat-associated protein
LTGSTGSSPTPLGFAGGWGYQQDSTGLQLLGHRYYDPSTGRFLTRDPIKDGRNWYGYCGNEPLGVVDPLGLSGEHGNKLGKQPAHVYLKYNKDGEFLKNGLTGDLKARYYPKELNGGYLRRIFSGPRDMAATLERLLTEYNPGQENKERWAGKRRVLTRQEYQREVRIRVSLKAQAMRAAHAEYNFYMRHRDGKLVGDNVNGTRSIRMSNGWRVRIPVNLGPVAGAGRNQ